MKEIELVLKLQGDTPEVLCSIFEHTVKDNQGAIALAVYLQIRPWMKHIAIKYHHFRIFVTNGDVKIKYVDTKEQIADIFMEQIDSELFGYIR